jgi:Pyruvate/2-oxoacid:ferredoxin oxidoreductase delta subunit
VALRRQIVTFDEEKCTGCGDCLFACAEGAIAIVNGKATLISDIYCDGLGACLGECPEDAIAIDERDAKAFDEAAVTEHLASQWARSPTDGALQHGRTPRAESGLGCPSAQPTTLQIDPPGSTRATGRAPSAARSLPHWPIKLNLVPPGAPFLDGADLMLVADCVSFANADFHDGSWSDRALLIGCPKFDDPDFALRRLTGILRDSAVRSLTVVHMEVPCCSGFWYVSQQAVAASEKAIPLRQVVVGVAGEVRQEEVFS